MERTKQPVTAAAIQKKLSRIDGMHAVGGVSGLYLYVRATSRLWILRYSFAKKRRDMTLGHLNDCSLEEARERALAARQQIRAGIDPLGTCPNFCVNGVCFMPEGYAPRTGW